MYYAVTGIEDPRFIPDDFMGLVVYEFYNDAAYVEAWRDKNMLERLLPDLPFPETIGRCVRGRLIIGSEVFDYSQDEMPFCRELFRRLGKGGTVIVKDARHTGHGRGVKRYVIGSVDDALSMLVEWRMSENFLIQRAIVQHPVMAQLNESSVNVVRLFTWRKGARVDVLYATLRFGVPGSITDMTRDEKGKELLCFAPLGLDGSFQGRLFDQDGKIIGHDNPSTIIPNWDLMVDCAKRGALQLDNFDLVGWDFAIGFDGMPICLEFNIEWPGTVYYQFANGPLAGERTDDLLAFLLDETLRENYLPKYMSL